jgi:hypothetical protein
MSKNIGGTEKRIKSFMKFSDIAKVKVKVGKENPISIEPLSDDDLPCLPNLPQENKVSLSDMDTKKLKPLGQEVNQVSEKIDIKFYGKVVKLPRGTSASTSYSYMEQIKVPKSSIWYIVVEKQDNELQMLKYNYKEGVNLASFVSDLKSYYIKRYRNDKGVVEMISNITVEGTGQFSIVKNIPPISVDGKKMISKITEDLIHLLSK